MKKLNKRNTANFNLISSDISKIYVGKKNYFKIFLKNKTIIKLIKGDTLCIDNQHIELEELYKNYIIAFQWFKNKYNESHYNILNYSDSSFEVTVKNDPEEVSYAYFSTYRDPEEGNQYKIPRSIEIEFNCLFNLDDWKFILGHEFAHFYKYLNIKKEPSFKILILDLLSALIFFILSSFMIVKIFNILKDHSIESTQTPLLFSFVFLFVFLSAMIIEYALYRIKNNKSKFKKYQEEFFCDLESYELFNDINLNNTFLYRNTSKLEKYMSHTSHPSNKNRIQFLLNKTLKNNFFSFNIINYLYIVKEDILVSYNLIIKGIKNAFRK